MNRLRKTYLPFILFVLAITLVSCDEMEDNYAPYIESGEIFYTPKAQELIAMSGYEKIQFNWDVTSNKSISDWVISYGENKTFVSNDGLGDKEKEYLLTGVEEGSHEFSIYSISDTGNESIYTKLTAEVYGAEYSASLDPRAIKTVSYDGVDGVIVFQSSTPSGGLTDVKYMNTSNVEITKSIEKDELILVLENLSIESPIFIRTYYLPTPPIDGVDTSLEEIASEWSEITLPDFSTILATITVDPSLGGATIGWTNAEAKEIRVNVVYTFNGELVTETIVTEEVDGEIVLPLLNDGAQNIVVSIADSFGNQFSKPFNVTPVSAVAIDRSNWIVIDRSAEAGVWWGVEMMFDGNEDTFWHTPWGVNGQYPHHCTVDMGAVKTLSSIWIARKWDRRVATKIEFLVSVDNVTWVSAGTFINQDPTSDAPQHYGLETLPEARYYKLNLLEGTSETATYGWESVIREFNVYGSGN